MGQKNKKITIVIVILVVLLSLSVTALAGTLLYNRFLHTAPTTVDVPGNIITPDCENSMDPNENVSSMDWSNTSQILSADESDASANPTPLESSVPASSVTASASSETTELSSGSRPKASALSLHTKQPEENKPFQVANMFPGDSETQYFRIQVSYQGDIIVRYHADIYPDYEKLAEVLKIRIRLLGSDGFLYDGLMRDMPKSLNHALHTTQSTQSELYYEITAYLDTSVGNEYMDKELIANFRWWVEETDHLDPPPTGDSSNIYWWMTFASGSCFALVLLLKKRSKEVADDVE